MPDNIHSVLPPRVQSYFFRTVKGAEIDLILAFGLKDKWAIEIKKGSTFSLNKGFYEACKSVQAQKKFVIHSGPDTFQLPNEITATSLYEFMKMLG